MSLSAVELWNQTGFLALNAGAQAPAFLIMAARLIAGWSVLLVIVLLIATWVPPQSEQLSSTLLLKVYPEAGGTG